MSYTSKNLSRLIIEDDDLDPLANRFTNPLQPHGEFGTGMFDDDGSRVPYGFGATSEFPADMVVPESDYAAAIQEIEAQGADCRSRATLAGLICKNQSQTNFCWSNAPVYSWELIRVMENMLLMYFSPASIAGPINNFRNQGGWGGAALKRMVSHGTSPIEFDGSSLYPANQVSKPNTFDKAMQIAANFCVKEWWVINTFQQAISCLLRGWPVAVGYDWWGHEVTLTRALWIDGALALEFRNSWGMEYGEDGYGILRGRKMYGSDYVTPRVSGPSPITEPVGSIAI